MPKSSKSQEARNLNRGPKVSRMTPLYKEIEQETIYQRQHLGDVVLALWYMMSEQTPEAKPCTVHDKFAMESEGAA